MKTKNMFLISSPVRQKKFLSFGNFIAIILLLIFIHFTAVSLSAETEYIATGYGFLETKDNIVKARDMATDMAKKMAVSMAVQELSDINTLIPNWSYVEKNIFPKYNHYITGFKILTEGVENPELYKINILVSINNSAIKQELEKEILTKGMQENIQVMVFLYEELPNHTIVRWWDQRGGEAGFQIFDQYLKSIFNNQNFTVLFPADFMDNKGQNPRLSLSDAQEIAAKANADIILNGKAMVLQKRGGSASLETFEAKISATAFNSRTGDIITRINESASATGIVTSEVSHQAITKIIQKTAQILSSRRDSISHHRTKPIKNISIKVNNIKSHKEFLILKNKLSEIVNDLQERRLKRGEAVFGGKWQGSINDLTDLIMEYNFSPLRISLDKATKNGDLTLSIKN